jgi:hypothetical protein
VAAIAALSLKRCALGYRIAPERFQNRAQENHRGPEQKPNATHEIQRKKQKKQNAPIGTLQ